MRFPAVLLFVTSVVFGQQAPPSGLHQTTKGTCSPAIVGNDNTVVCQPGTPQEPASLAYPWVSANTFIPDEQAVRLSLQVRDYPTTDSERRGFASLSFLQHVHLVISTPLQVNPDPAIEGWHSCIIADIAPEVWNNDDAISKPLANVSIRNDVTVLEIRASALSGNWHGLIILRRRGVSPPQPFDYKEFLAGGVGGVGMSVRETMTNGKLEQLDNSKGLIETRNLLMQSGVPVGSLKGDELRRACPSGVQYSQTFKAH